MTNKFIVLYLPKTREKFNIIVDKIVINNGCITIILFSVKEFQTVLDTLRENKEFFIHFYIYDEYSYCSIPTKCIRQIFGNPNSNNIFMYTYLEDVLYV